MSTGNANQAVVEDLEVEDELLEDEYEDEEDLDGEEDEEPTEETARETVERVLREAKDKEPSSASEEEGEAPEPRLNSQQQVAEKPKLSRDYVPPARFNAAQKEAFNKAPKPVKEAVYEMVRDQEAKFTQSQQQLSIAQRESRHIVETVRPYLLAHPELQEQGYTESSIVAGLIASHQQLTNPKTAMAKWLDIGAQVGVSKEVLAALQEHVGGQQQQKAVDPHFQELQQKVNRLDSVYQQTEAQKRQQAVGTIVSELEAVKNEQDPRTGQYIYPELHNDQFIERAKPLVSALVGTVSGISYGDALRRAYDQLTGRQNGNSTTQMQSRLPSNGNSTPIRATQGAVSVRGRSAPEVQGQSLEIPNEALGSAKDSVKWALNQLRRG